MQVAHVPERQSTQRCLSFREFSFFGFSLFNLGFMFVSYWGVCYMHTHVCAVQGYKINPQTINQEKGRRKRFLSALVLLFSFSWKERGTTQTIAIRFHVSSRCGTWSPLAIPRYKPNRQSKQHTHADRREREREGGKTLLFSLPEGNHQHHPGSTAACPLLLFLLFLYFFLLFLVIYYVYYYYYSLHHSLLYLRRFSLGFLKTIF